MSSNIEVQLACRSPRLARKDEVRAWAAEALRAQCTTFEVTVRIVDEVEGARLNQTFRRSAGATNVLTFALESPPGIDAPQVGDIAICAPVIKREAKEQGKPVSAHCAHMVVHGILHLLGYDHQRSDEAARMEAEEVSILCSLGFPDPYITEVQ